MCESGHDCMFLCDGSCSQVVEVGSKTASVDMGVCPYTYEERLATCGLAVVDLTEKTSMMEKRATWSEVKRKGEAIAATGGVVIEVNNYAYVKASTLSSQIRNSFPVELGGPYNTVLYKTKWKGKQTGGWVQSFSCSCTWGRYNGGEPGSRFKGRFCSHAYAVLITVNARARQDFFGDRTASKMMNPGGRGLCTKCGTFDTIDGLNHLCDDCLQERAFEAMVARLYTLNEDERKESIAFLESALSDGQQVKLRESFVIRDIGGLREITSGKHRAVIPVARKSEGGYNKTATRFFSKEEQDDLQDENIGLLARNHDRFKGDKPYSL